VEGPFLIATGARFFFEDRASFFFSFRPPLFPPLCGLTLFAQPKHQSSFSSPPRSGFFWRNGWPQSLSGRRAARFWFASRIFIRCRWDPPLFFKTCGILMRPFRARAPPTPPPPPPPPPPQSFLLIELPVVDPPCNPPYVLTRGSSGASWASAVYVAPCLFLPPTQHTSVSCWNSTYLCGQPLVEGRTVFGCPSFSFNLTALRLIYAVFGIDFRWFSYPPHEGRTPPPPHLVRQLIFFLFLLQD